MTHSSAVARDGLAIVKVVTKETATAEWAKDKMPSFGKQLDSLIMLHAEILSKGGK